MKESEHFTTVSLPMMSMEMEDDFDSSLDGLFAMTQSKARAMFLRHGELPATFCLISKHPCGKCLITQVLCNWSNDREKAAVMQEIKSMINIKNDEYGYLVKSFVFAAEAWVGSDKTVRPSKDPDRIEVVSVIARERGRPDALYAMAKIKHHALSSSPSLDSWDVIDNAEMLLDMFDDGTTAKTIH